MRRRDWPEKLAQSIRDAKTFDDEHNYCLTFAADCVRAMTDVDYLAEYRGLTREEATAKFRATEHQSFYHYLVATFEKIPLAKAQRGDLIVRTEPELSVGLCCGQNAAFVSSEGMAYHPTLKQRWAFKVR